MIHSFIHPFLHSTATSLLSTSHQHTICVLGTRNSKVPLSRSLHSSGRRQTMSRPEIVCVHVCVHECVHVCMHTCAHVHVCVCVCTCACVHVSMHMCVCTHVCLCVCARVCVVEVSVRKKNAGRKRVSSMEGGWPPSTLYLSLNIGL